MNIFISFAYTGTNIKQTHARLKNIVSLVNKTNNFAYCNLFDKSIINSIKNNNTKQIFIDTFKEESKADYIFIIISKPKISHGQCMEIGVAVNLDIPIIIFEQTSVKEQTYIENFAKHIYQWSSEENLYQQISKAIKILNPRN